MRRLATLLAIPILLATLGALAATECAAQELTVPCCAGGARPNKRCQTDGDCPGACVGGARDGRPCGQAGCPAACVGGADAGRRCTADADCRPACEGGVRDGLVCGEDGGPGCPDGTCSAVGSCGDPGQCTSGTCSAQCLVRSKSKKPDNPASRWLGLPELPAVRLAVPAESPAP